ncbi:glycoside hydrolase family 132 protein [Canariomyces notabilis]|uniref:Glycoside hydrolase family 132 protein n=1 Tax=Canariomyces notabilis TaxID=2074819 RepID=A0AAN6YXF1_9PEZI|nr:glycoside hydrolase family 132 protein [Canariomyces arenarius]
MKGFITTAVAAAAVVGVAAQPHNHGHHHRHAKKHDHAAIAKRDTVVVTEVVEGPTVVKYVLDGQEVDASKAEKGISDGVFVVMGSTKPSFTAPAPIVSTSIASDDKGGQFFEKAVTTSTSSSAPPPATSSTAPASSTSSPVSQGTGIDADFPDGELDCSNVPTDYGAIAIPWTGTNGWTTLASFGKWIKGVAVDNIVSPTSGTCSKEMMCSYACPPGYEKTQWPEDSQGATGQSVGGLWCNENGKLELTRPKFKKLCQQGAGGVFIRNELSSNAAVCRTDYPGNEAMVIPLDTYPGNTYPLTNTDSSTYYKWQGKPTTAQYYVNKLGYEVEEACTWKSSKYPNDAGNWAPCNIGVGKSESGITYISIFPNLPTSTAVLDFDIEITGDISGTCWLKKGSYYGGGNGCTVGMKEGGTATIVFKNSS